MDAEQMKHETERLVALRASVEETLLKIPGVVGVGVGLKTIRGAWQVDTLSFRVFVEKKKPEKDIPPGQLIPKTIQGIPTDVLDLPTVESNASETYRPLRAGAQLETEKKAGTFTLGCLGQEKEGLERHVVLSNYHTLFADDGKIGDGVGQPVYDTGKDSSCGCCRRESKLIGTILNGAIGGLVDCGLILLDGEIASNRFAHLPDRQQIVGTLTPWVCMPVMKDGATTGLTYGVVIDVHYMCRNEDKLLFRDQVRIVSVGDPPQWDNPWVWGDSRFSDRGDSGAAVVDFDSWDETRKVVGLNWASGDGLIQIPDGPRKIAYYAVANRISNVMASMGIQIPPSSWMTEQPSRTATNPWDELWEQKRNELNQIPLGREYVAVIERNFDEVIDLVHHARKATVAWHRNRGPDFIQRNMKPVQNPTQPLVKTVDGVTTQQLIASMAQALGETGSQRLVGEVTQFLPSTLKYESCNTLAEIVLLIILESVAKATPAAAQKFLRTLDPLKVPEIKRKLDTKIGTITVTLKNIQVNGIRGSQVTGTTADLPKGAIRFRIEMSKLVVPGEIDISHPLYGAKGRFQCGVRTIDVDMVLGMTASVVPPQIERVELTIAAGQVSIEIAGFGPILTPIINGFANVLSRAIADELTTLLESALREPLREWLNQAIREAWTTP